MLCRNFEHSVNNIKKSLTSRFRCEMLENACAQIEKIVPNLDALVQESNQEELELGSSWLAQRY